MTTYTATADNGQQFTRTSKKVYTHAALVLEADGTYSLAGFASSADLALKAAKSNITGFTSLCANDLKIFRYSQPERYAKGMEAIAAARIEDAKRTPVVVEVAA
jgi:hypothetical protein